MICPACNTPLDSRTTFCPTCGRSVDDPFVGQIIAGRYEVEKRIAIGGFGSIYRAYEAEQDRLVALKIMHRELAADTKLVARFRREGEVLTRLCDPHTVATLELGETPDGLPFIAMELLEGEPLLRLFQLHGRMPWQRVLTYARGVCSALGEAHAIGIVHRDLKPGNIFITNEDVVKVLDFGIAKIIASSEMPNPQELTVMGTAVGTVEYMAPEQLMGGRADPRTDIYTLGVLVYEMVTGRRPFNEVGLELLTTQLSKQAPPPSSIVAVPRAVDEVVLRCLAPDTADRYQNVHELSRALAQVLAANPIVPVMPGSRPPPIGPHATLQRAETPPPITGPFPRPPVTGPFARPPVTGTFSRAATPLPTERPLVRRLRTQVSGSPRLLIGAAIGLFALGVGLAIAYFR